MTNTSTNDKPLFRVTFSRITGKDEDGKDILDRPREIGAVWPRRGNKKGGILALDIIPVELAQRQGVLFILPVDANTDNGGAR
jgi:hypothetical protein